MTKIAPRIYSCTFFAVQCKYWFVIMRISLVFLVQIQITFLKLVEGHFNSGTFKPQLFTGKSLSAKPQYDKRLFFDLPVQYMKTTYKLRTWGEHVVCINCSECQNKKQFVCTTCSPNVLSLSFSCIELVNQYCGLVDVRINASDKDFTFN